MQEGEKEVCSLGQIHGGFFGGVLFCLGNFGIKSIILSASHVLVSFNIRSAENKHRQKGATLEKKKKISHIF